MKLKKTRIETENAPPSTGFRSQGLIAGGVLFTGGQIGAAMPSPGVLREPCDDMAEAVQVTLAHLEQVTLAAGCQKEDVFEVSAFPRLGDQKGVIENSTQQFLGFKPTLFNYLEVSDTAAHALIEMDWMAVAGSDLDVKTGAMWLNPLGHGEKNVRIESGPFNLWNKLAGQGDNLAEASENLLNDISDRLKAQGGSFDNLVKLTVYIKEFDAYPQFNEATKSAFADIIPPTRSVLVAPSITGDAHLCMDVVALR
ncbi:MAG: RidA family protein [Brevefilum sp.]